MNILFDIRSIVAIAIFIICAIAFTLLFLGRKIGEWRKARARKLLSEEIAALERKIKQLEQWETIVQSMRAREVILCPTLLKGIVDILPDPNRINGRGTGTILQGHEVKLFVAGRGDVRFQLKFVVDADDVPTHEKGLTVRVEPLGQEVRFTLKIQNRRQRIQGVDVEVNSWYWDLRFSGIQLISDDGFGRIIDLVLSSRVVNDALGLNPSMIGNRTWDF